MLINVTLPLQSATSSSRPPSERLNHSPARPDADAPQTLPAVTNDVGSPNQLLTTQGSLNVDANPIEDVAAADAATDYAQNSIRLDPGTAFLAQANQLPETVLELLQ
jgi:hypothetical protein